MKISAWFNYPIPFTRIDIIVGILLLCIVQLTVLLTSDRLNTVHDDVAAIAKRVSHFEQITQDWAAEQVRIVGKKTP